MNYQSVVKDLTKTLEEFFRAKGEVFKSAVDIVCECLNSGHKILAFGNGGSAAQAQHFASELVNKFLKVRPAIAAVALTTDTSSLTSIANDSSFDFVFSRQIEALGKRGDVALGISTSGESPNVIEAIKTAKKRGLLTVALTGEGGGKLASLTEYLLDVPSRETPRIQEAHLLLIHVLAEEIEKKVSSES